MRCGMMALVQNTMQENYRDTRIYRYPDVIQAWKSNANIEDMLLQEILSTIKQKSRKYAKQQQTFFRKFTDQKAVTWWDLSDTTHAIESKINAILHSIDTFMSKA